MCSASKLYDSVGESTIAFNVIDPISKESAKCVHGNQHCKQYRFRDGSRIFVYKQCKNFRWWVSFGDSFIMLAVKGVGYIGGPVLRIAGPNVGTELRSVFG